MLIVNDESIEFDTPSLIAVFKHGSLISLVRKSDRRKLVSADNTNQAPLELVYTGPEHIPLGIESGDRVTSIPIGAHSAEFRIESWNGDGILTISEDLASGDLVVEPSGYASRPGLRACRWTLAGIDPDLKLVAPLWQGIRLSLADTIIHDQHFPWPFEWQAGLAILDSGHDGGFWVRCEDSQYRYKALHVGTRDDSHSLSFDTESYGPLDLSLGTGGLAWRINVYEGNWQTPAAQYRDWLAQAYSPDRTQRPEWLNGLRFAVSWCPCDPGILDALAQQLDPRSVLLHIPNWRTDGYDQNYPTFVASSTGRAFIQKAQAMGYRTMPHMNAIDMDPTHPTYTCLRDFQYRDIESKRLQGWTWVDSQVKPLQESNAMRLHHQDKNTMVKIHPGLSMWRSILSEHVRDAVNSVDLKLVFLDVTLCTWNLHNCLVENMTPTEGMRLLIAKVAGIGDGLYVGGEGRNEITMTGQCFSQVHLFRSSGRSIDGLERTGGCPLNEFLFGRWSRSFGYSSLGGHTEDELMRMRLHVGLGAIPTVTLQSATDIEQPNPAVAEMLALARQQ